MRVALCVPHDSRLNATCVPYGLGYIAAYLRRQIPSVTVKIFDGMAGHDVYGELERFKPDVVGVTASTPQALKAYKLLCWIRKSLGKNVLTVMGGVHASAMVNEALQFADVVVVGDGEKTFVELLKLHRLGHRPFGIIKGDPISNLDDLPQFPFDMVAIKEYLKHGPWLPNLEHPIHNLVTSRGCPYRCPFCINSTRTTKVRYHAAKRVLDEILYIRNRFGVKNFYFSDDEFLINVKRLKQLAALFKKHGVDKWIKWACQARTRSLSLDVLKLAKSMGCVTVSVGLESGCQRMLGFWKDGTTTVEDHERAIRLARETGIAIGGSFIYGGPDETFEEMKESYGWFTRQDGLEFVGTGTIIPYPGTTMWKLCKEQKLLPNNVDYSRLAPTCFVDQTYVINRKVHPKAYGRFLVHVARMARMHAEARHQPTLRNFFLKMSRRPVWWWAWFNHPFQMLRILYRIMSKNNVS